MFSVSMAAEAAVVTNVTCSAYDYASVSGPAQCVQGGGLAYGPTVEANATVSAGVSMPNASSAFLNASINELASEVPNLGSTGVGPSSATASATINLNLFTQGPVRQGLVEIEMPTLSWINAPEGYSGQMSLTLGSITGSCQPSGVLTCQVGSYYITSSGALILPFTLGDSFTFQFSQTDSVYGDLNSGDSEGADQTALAFRFFEADGSTPVTMFDSASTAPEPATFGIFTLGIAGIGLAIRLRHALKK